MEKASVNGVELEYEVRGSGEPVLLISTGPIADSFRPVLSEKALVGRYRLISYRQRRAMPGAGCPVSFGEHAADAAGLLAQLGVHRAHLAGHSTGAAIALQMAVDFPDMVQSLALWNRHCSASPALALSCRRRGRPRRRTPQVTAMAPWLCSSVWPPASTGRPVRK